MNYNAMDLISPESPQYYLFKYYGVAVKQFLSKVLYLKRFSRDKQPAIYYSTPQKAWATLIQPIINGESEIPVCTFNLTNMTPKDSEIMNGFAYVIDSHETDINKKQITYSPSIWELTYKINIWAKLIEDMDILISQCLIYSMSNKCWATIVNKTWAEIYIRNISIDDNLEPGETKDRSVRRSLDLIVRRAYLPRESYNVNVINEILFTII